MLCADADHFRSLMYQAQAERDELRKGARFVVDFEPGLFGPFPSRAAADEWASRHAARTWPAMTTSWTVRPIEPAVR